MQDLFKSIALVAPADVPVLITGESGTGKELVARAIHRHSGAAGRAVPAGLPRRPEPEPGRGRALRPPQGARSPGRTRTARGSSSSPSGGTVLLDEVGDIPPDLQVKLLRAIEHREVTPVGDARPRPTDIRVIAATNRPLAELMAAGQFREDLFFRLSVFPIHIPPLRERREDIPALAEHFLRQSRLPDVADTRLADGRARRTPLPPLGGQRPRAAQRHRARGHRRPRPDRSARSTSRRPPPIGGRSPRSPGTELREHGSPSGPGEQARRRRPRPPTARSTSDSSSWPSRPSSRPSWSSAATTGPPPPRCSGSTGRPSARSCGSTAWDESAGLLHRLCVRSTSLWQPSDIS